jgi:Transposase DDE domain group 1
MQPVGETQHTLFSLQFNRSVEVEARPERLSGDAGALLLREVWSRLGMDGFFGDRLFDPRNPLLITHPQSELLRTQVLLLAQGWRDQDDADSLRDDPLFRISVSDRSGSQMLGDTPSLGKPAGLASQPTLSRLTNTLGAQREALREGTVELAARRIRAMNRGHRLRYVTVDLDSMPLEVHGHQEGTAYNGHYGCDCYHPLVASIGETGDLLDLRLRPGNSHTAKGSLDFLLPLLDQVEEKICQVASVRMDAGFPEDKILSALESRRVGYVARIAANERLDTLAADFLEKQSQLAPPLESPRLAFQELSYAAESWSQKRRIVAVYHHEPGELFGNRFYLVTNWDAEQKCADELLALYRERGKAEGHFGELKSTFAPTLSSTRRRKHHYRGEKPARRTPSGDPFAANEVRLLLNALAYNLLHVARCLIEKLTSHGCSLKRLRERHFRLPARVLLHARRITVVLAAHVTNHWRRLHAAIRSLRWQPPPIPH